MKISTTLQASKSASQLGTAYSSSPGYIVRTSGLVKTFLRGNSADLLANEQIRDDPEISAFDLACQAIARDLTVHLSKREQLHVQVAKSFVPSIVRKVAARTEETVMHRCDGCVVACVPGGFSNLSEQIAVGTDGAEIMSKCLNKFFTPLVEIIETYHGDVLKLNADGLTILFEATDDYAFHKFPCGTNESGQKTPLQLATIRATACCLEIHRKIHDIETSEDGMGLFMQIGVGAGPCALVQVGGGHRLDRYEFIIAGSPVRQLATAAPLANSGEIVLSPEAWAEVEYAAEEGELIADGPEGFRRLVGFHTEHYTYPTVKQAAFVCAKLKEQAMIHEGKSRPGDDFETFMRFIPRAVFKHLRSGNTSSINEVRTVTVTMVVIDGVDTFMDEGAKLAQKLMANMQRAIYRSEGSLNKFIMDDESMVFTIAFGLPPLVHIDDPSRAVIACYDMVAVLKSMGLSGQFAVSTGRVFCGIIGSNLRREYMVMGDTTNRARALMRLAGSNSVLIDETTYTRVGDQITCRRMQPVKDASSGHMMKVFAPIMPVVCGIEVGQSSAVMYQRSWFVRKTRIEVQLPNKPINQVFLPWRANSKLLGGKSPILDLTRWREFQKIKYMLDEGGEHNWLKAGGAIVLSGPSGIGKQELSEFAIHKAASAGLLPLFGTMQRRTNQQFRAVIELAQNCLDILSKVLPTTPSVGGARHLAPQPPRSASTLSSFGHVQSVQSVGSTSSAGADSGIKQQNANKGNASNAILQTMFGNKVHLHPILSTLGFEGFDREASYKVRISRSASNASFGVGHGSASATVRETAISRTEVLNMGATLSSFSAPPQYDEGDDLDAAAVATALVEAVAEHFPVVVLLRLRRSTDIKDSLGERVATFWSLCSSIADLAMRRRRLIGNGDTDLKPILLIVLSRKLDEFSFGQTFWEGQPTTNRCSGTISARPSHLSVTGNFWEVSKLATMDSPSSVTRNDLPIPAKCGTDFAPDDVEEEDKVPVAATPRKTNQSMMRITKHSTAALSTIREALGSRIGRSIISATVKVQNGSDEEKASRATGMTTTTDGSGPAMQRQLSENLEPVFIQCRSLTEDAAVELMCLCLGLGTSRGGSLISRRLRSFVSAVTMNTPAYIQECLDELLRENLITIADGECTYVGDLTAVNIADWVHTSVIGGAISQLESLGPAKHHIMKVGTILSNAFSPLDLMAVNKALFGQLPRLLRFYDQSKLLSACSELVQMGLLKRLRPASKGTPADCAPLGIPRFTVSSFLFRQVTLSMVPKIESIHMKRVILVSRFIFRTLHSGIVHTTVQRNYRFPRIGSVVLQKSRWVRPWWVFTLMSSQPKPHDSEEDLRAEEYIERPKLLGVPLLSMKRKASQQPYIKSELMEMLFTACALGNAPLVHEIFGYHKDSVDVSEVDGHGYTLLHFACSSGQQEIVETLCNLKASISAQSHNLETPVLIAAQRGHLKVLRFLFQHYSHQVAGCESKFSYWVDNLPNMSSPDAISLPLAPCFQQVTYASNTVEAFNAKRHAVWEFLQSFLLDTADNEDSESAQRVASKRKSALENGFAHAKQPVAMDSQATGPSERASDPLFQGEGHVVTTESAQSKNTKGTNTTKSGGPPNVFGAKSSVISTAYRNCKLCQRLLPKWLYRSIGALAADLPKKRLQLVLSGRTAMVVMLICITLALYLPDVWVTAGSESSIVADVTLTIVMLIFLLELISLSIVDSSYPRSAFFVADCLGTVSMAWDISFLLGASASEPVKLENNDQGLTFLRALRSGKLAARASRLSRIIKVMRYVFDFSSQRQRRFANSEDEDEEKMRSISKQLTNILSTRIACLTVILLIVAPAFSTGLYPETDDGMRVWIDGLSRKAGNLTATYGNPLGPAVLNDPRLSQMITTFAQFYRSKPYGPYSLCLVCGGPDACWRGQSGTSLPFKEPGRGSFRLEVKADHVIGLFDTTPTKRAEADMNICMISLAVVLMCATCLLLNYFAAELCIRPLDVMMMSLKDSARCIINATDVFGQDDCNEEFVVNKESGEIQTLDRVVRKVCNFAAHAGNSNFFKKEPDLALSKMKDEDLGVLEMTHGFRSQGKSKTMSMHDMSSRLDACEPIIWDDFQWIPKISENVGVTNQWRLEEIEFTYEVVTSWLFTPLDLTSAKLELLAEWFILNHPGTTNYVDINMDSKDVHNFVSRLNEGYLQNSYHNFMHAVDVLHCTSRMATLVHAERMYSECNQVALLVAALGHDLGHFGYNNSFLKETQHDLAIRYNDHSPLENMHCCKLFELIGQEDIVVFKYVANQEYWSARKLMIDAILHTDMVHHPGMLKELELLYEINSQVFNLGTHHSLTDGQVETLKTTENKHLLVKTMLHGADLSNQAKAWEVAHKWAYRVLDEYFQQGDKEREMGLQVQMLNDRTKVNKPNSQIGFIEFVVAPWLVAVVRIVKPWCELPQNAEFNLQQWQRLWVTESNPPLAEKQQVEGRIQRLKQSLDSVSHNLRSLDKPRGDRGSAGSSSIIGAIGLRRPPSKVS